MRARTYVPAVRNRTRVRLVRSSEARTAKTIMLIAYSGRAHVRRKSTAKHVRVIIIGPPPPRTHDACSN